MQEQWKPIPDSNYEISNHGRLRHAESKYIRKLSHDPRGYPIANIWFNGRTLTIAIHQHVARVFIGDKPFPEAQVNHIDGDKTNNRADNLEWVTPKENIAHAIELGLHNPDAQRGGNNSNAKLSDSDAMEILTRYHSSSITQTALADEYGVHSTTIGLLVRGKTFASVYEEFMSN